MACLVLRGGGMVGAELHWSRLLAEGILALIKCAMHCTDNPLSGPVMDLKATEMVQRTP